MLKLGPFKGTVSKITIGISWNVTWYAMDSSSWVTTHKVLFRSNWAGKA